MIINSRFNVVLDACVLYPAPIRDILLNLAEQDLFSPKWSETIQEEWIRNLLINRPDLTRKKLEKTINAMNGAFPNAMVKSYKKLISSLDLPDSDDRHVLAAAIKSESDVIVTFNLKDFPSSKLKKYKIEALHPDEFICNLSEIDEVLTKQAFENQLNSLKNPPIPRIDLLQTLRKGGLDKCLNVFE